MPKPKFPGERRIRKKGSDQFISLTRVGEIGLFQLVLLNGKTLVENLRRLLTRDADVARDLLIAANAEGSDGETSCKKVRRRNDYDNFHEQGINEAKIEKLKGVLRASKHVDKKQRRKMQEVRMRGLFTF
jgi:hypothetical protein